MLDERTPRWKPGAKSKNRKPKRRFPPEVLTDSEVRALMDACGPYTMTAVRNRALIAVLYRSGLRISEALALYPKDIDFASGAIRVLHGKGDKSRTVGIDTGAIEYVQQWLEVRQRWNVNGCHPIFCSRSGQRLGEGYIRRLFPSLGRMAGIQKRVHPHGLRHTHAAQLREEGVDVGIISKQLGHVSIATTARYLDHIAPSSVLRTMQMRVW
jgi:site-specific recombinase XerD